VVLAEYTINRRNVIVITLSSVFNQSQEAARIKNVYFFGFSVNL